MLHPSPLPKLQFIDANGAPYAGGTLFTYKAGTSTPLATYADAAGTPNATAIVLDSAGRASVFLGLNAYKFVLKDVNGVTVYTQDQVAQDFVDGTSVQTLSNKTIDDTSSVRVKAGNLVLENGGDATAVATFDGSLISTASARIIQIPDASFKLAGQNLANQFSKTQQLAYGAAIADVTGDLTLGTDANTFPVNVGSGTINAIKTAGIQAGTLVRLAFKAAITLKYNTAGGAGTAKLILQNAADFMVNIPDCITLLYDGSNWVEMARSVLSTTASGFVRVAKVTIANAAVKTLPTTPVFIILNPGLLRELVFLKMVLQSDLTAATYTNVNAAVATRLRTTTGTIAVSADVDQTLFNSTLGSKYMAHVGPKIDTVVHNRTTFENNNFELQVDNAGSGVFTGGDTNNTLTVWVYYLVQDLP